MDAAKGGVRPELPPPPPPPDRDSIHFLPTRREIDTWIEGLLDAHGVHVRASDAQRGVAQEHTACDLHHTLRSRGGSSSSSASSSMVQGAPGVSERAISKLRAKRAAVEKAEGTARTLRAKLGHRAPAAPLHSDFAPPSRTAASPLREDASYSLHLCHAEYKQLCARLRAAEADLAALRARIAEVRELRALRGGKRS